MNIYYQNKIATLTGSPVKTAETPLINVYEPMLEMRAEFIDAKEVTIEGNYGKAKGGYNNVVAVDSLCLGNTNAVKYHLSTREGECSGNIRDHITIFEFNETLFIDGFTLTLEGIEGGDPLYLGHLFLGIKTVLPRFAVGPNTGIMLTGEASRSFSGQVYGMKRITLDSFSANFPRITAEESRTIKDYIKAVQNVEPHIIDPYAGARSDFPPMYATLNINEASMTKRDEDGFYYTCQMAWQEAR
jgi:hypothetical protein